MTLLERLRDAARTAGDALVPIPTRREPVVDDGLTFTVHVVAGAIAKPPRPGPVDPFLPPEPALVVAPWGPDHLAVLNKYPVVPDHLLLVTRAFVPQEAPLDPSDVDALHRALDALDGLVFYNSSRTAGASQAHRHLQLLPRAPGPLRFPTEARLRDAPPFPAVRAPLGADAGETYRAYRSLLAATGGDYNLLATRDDLWLVPRCAEAHAGIGVNAMGFAGSLLVRDEPTLAALVRIGPLSVLRAVAGTASRPPTDGGTTP